MRFERKAISSFDPGSDMIFSVLAAVAQEESRSISENVNGLPNTREGIRNIGNNRVLGYDTDKKAARAERGRLDCEIDFDRYTCGASGQSYYTKN